MSSAGIFVFGVLVFAIVAAACALIAWGIVTERRDRLELEAEQGEALERGREQTTTTRADARTVEA